MGAACDMGADRVRIVSAGWPRPLPRGPPTRQNWPLTSDDVWWALEDLNL